MDWLSHLGGLVVPLAGMVMVIFIVGINSYRHMRARELEAHRELRMREMEHERRLKELEIEKAKIEVDKAKTP